MLGNLLIGALGVLLVLIVFWAVRRTGRIRAEARSREAEALAIMRAGGVPPAAPKAESQGETVFAGLPSQIVPGGRGIEVNDVSEVVDIDELLRDEQAAAAERARALLEEPTNIDLSPETFQPVAPRGGAAAAKPPVKSGIATAAGAAAAMAEIQARPPVARPKPAAPARPAAPVAAATPGGSGAPARGGGGSPAAARAQALASAGSVASMASATPLHAASGGTAVATAPPVIRPAAPARPAAAARPAARADKPASADGDVPLRELALAWFEARGYRGAPASPAVRPIELVLRHRDDPGRAYALVVEPARVTGDRVVSLAEQARAIGLVRLLVVAETGAEPEASSRKKGVRLMDRPTMNAELKKLDLSVAAKIIAVARKRATARAA